MKQIIQKLLLLSYRFAFESGILSTSFGRAIFEFLYSRYKALFEAGEVEHLRAYVVEGGTVIDVGANIGFFTLKFAAWVGDSGRVFSIEPEQRNFDRLSQRVNQHGYISRVSLVKAAAAEKTGEVMLAINKTNPMDHRLSDSGILVRAITIDELCAICDWQEVCLVKIDVQGAEGRVIAGAIETIKRFSPALFVEIEEGSVKPGSQEFLFLNELTALGYWPYILEKNGPKRLKNINAMLTLVKVNGYADCLFLKSKDTQ
jgi:FkbM family methyltransferase